MICLFLIGPGNRHPVDDAIVEIENIVRHMNMGKKPFIAAIDAAMRLGWQ